MQEQVVSIIGECGYDFAIEEYAGIVSSGYLTDGTTILKWVTEDGRVQVDALFEALTLTIRVRVADAGDMSAAIEAAHRLVGHISGLYAHGHGRIGEYRPAGGSADEN